MDPDTVLSRSQFMKLIDASSAVVENRVARDQLTWWNKEPNRVRREFGAVPERDYIPFDAVLECLASEIVKQGPKRQALAQALPGLQLVLGNAIDRPETFVAVSVGRTPGHLGIAAGTMAEISEAGIFNPFAFVATYTTPIPPVVKLVRERARKHGIPLPDTFALPPGEVPVWARDEADLVSELGGLKTKWEKEEGRPFALHVGHA